MRRIRLLLRLLDIQRVLVRHGLDELISSVHLFRPLRFVFYLWPANWGRKRSSASRGQRIREALEELGPIYVKFGQSVSTRQDLLPEDIGSELAKLQDQVPPRPFRTVRQIVEQELGEPLEQLFASFEREPIGVLFSGGIDSGAVFLVTHHLLLRRGQSPARLKAFTLAVDGGGADMTQAARFLNDVDLGLFLEADRMRSLTINQANLDNQRNAVQEERRLSVDNRAYGKTFEAIFETAYDNFAYKHSTIGSMADLDAATVEDVAEFFRIYYAPNNAVLSLVGDFKTEEALAKIEKYFGAIPAQPPPAKPDMTEPEQKGERRKTLEDSFARLIATCGAVVEVPGGFVAAVDGVLDRARDATPAIRLSRGGEGDRAKLREAASRLMPGNSRREAPAARSSSRVVHPCVAVRGVARGRATWPRPDS